MDARNKNLELRKFALSSYPVLPSPSWDLLAPLAPAAWMREKKGSVGAYTA